MTSRLLPVPERSVRSTTRPHALRTPTCSGTDRAQAYTLEGFVGAAIVLAAALLAVQSGGLTAAVEESNERDRQNQLQQEAQDALVVAATADEGSGNLTEFVTSWDGNQFSSDEIETYVLGEVANEQFEESPRSEGYRITVNFEAENGSMARETVYTSADEGPSADAVASSYTVTSFEGEETTSAGERNSSNERERGPFEAVVGVEVTVW